MRVKEEQVRVIIIGAGEVGFHVAKRLVDENKEVVVVDQDQSVLDQLADLLDVETVCGSGSNPQILEAAGIEQAGMLLTVTDSDETNLIACTFSNILAPDLIRVARVRNTDYTSYKEVLAQSLKIDIVVNPEDEVIGAIERLLNAPGAVEINQFSTVAIKMVAVWIRGKSRVSGMNMARLKTYVGIEGFIVAAILRSVSKTR